MSVPPYILAAITTVGAGWWSDKIQKRGIVTMTFSVVGAVGYTMLIATDIPAVNYIGLFLAASGMYPLIPVVVSWGANNVGGSLKKGVATAIIVSVGNAGGVVSSFVYPREDAPRYYTGHGVCLAYCVLCFFLALWMTIYYARANRQKEARNAARERPFSPEEKKMYEDEGDNVDWFKYTT